MLTIFNKKIFRNGIFLIAFVAGMGGASPQAVAIPYFARKYDVRCSRCHSLPPMLNEFGHRFVANGYRLPELRVARRTLPFAVWVSERAELDHVRDRGKGFPNRVELISADALAPWVSYFAEWRVLSYQTTSSQRLLGRHGRFEDLFLQFRAGNRLTITAGQYRMLNQWDVSRRLSLSEPVAFSAGVGGAPARDARLNSLRSFSWSGRAPAIRATLQSNSGGSTADGWFHEITVPLSGELSIPLGDEAERNASFALEGRAKGVVYETYYRRGLSSVGAAFFAGSERWVGNATAVWQAGDHSLLLSAGTARFRQERNDFRLTIGETWVPARWAGLGVRVDHQSGVRRRPAVLPVINLSFPASKYTFLFTYEQRLQAGNHGAFFELGAVF